MGRHLPTIFNMKLLPSSLSVENLERPAIYFYFRERESKQGRGAEGERESQAGSTRSAESDSGLDPATLGS